MFLHQKPKEFHQHMEEMDGNYQDVFYF